jgi:hypothetical protein
VQTGIDAQALPRKLGTVLNNLTGKHRDRLFPYTFLTYIELHRSPLFEQFVALFDGLPAAAVEKLRGFVEGDNHDRPGMRVAILQGLEEIAAELHVLRSRVRALRQTISKLKEHPVKDATFQEELDQLEIERSALASIARSILDKDTYNFFTDEGLLPNYAFPEAGIVLRSVILRRKQQDDGRGRTRPRSLNMNGRPSAPSTSWHRVTISMPRGAKLPLTRSICACRMSRNGASAMPARIWSWRRGMGARRARASMGG